MNAIPVEDVKLSNIRIFNPISISADSFKKFPARVPEDLKGYPENRLTFGLEIPASAFYFRNAKRIVLQDVEVEFKENEARPAFCLDNARNVKLRSVLLNSKRLELTPLNVVQVNKSEVEVSD